MQKVLIVGGGIAGLTAATALGRQGVACTVLELRAAPAGAAITIQNRAINALQDLGLLDELLQEGLPRTQADIFRYFDGSGNPLPTPPMPPEPDTGLPSAFVIHRVPLSRVLRGGAQAAGAQVRDGVSIASLQQDAEGVDVVLTDGSADRFDLVVGADGVRSTTRKLAFGDAVIPQYTGTTMFRWVVEGVPEVGRPGFYTSHGILNVVMRLRDGSLYLATGKEYATKPARFSPEEARSAVAENLAPFDAPLLRAMSERLTSDSEIVVSHYDWLLQPNPWYRGRVLLIGDAAHATTAFMASGGGMAIEDAAVLGEEVATGGPVQQVLDRFMRRRFERARMVVETSVQLGEMFVDGASAAEQNAVRGPALAALKAPY